MNNLNKNFTITFWIRLSQNPGWTSKDSDILFPPFIVNEHINVHFCKYGAYLKVYILHPHIGYRKLVANIKDYINKDLFIALTNTENKSHLYLNSNLVTSITTEELIKTLEIGDFVMVKLRENDLENVHVGDAEVVFPAKVNAINNNRVTLYFYTIDKVTELDINRIHY